jgi:hypothetical protein
VINSAKSTFSLLDLQRSRLTLGQLGEILPLEQIVRLEEDLPQPGGAGGVVPTIEPVEPVEFLVDTK